MSRSGSEARSAIAALRRFVAGHRLGALVGSHAVISLLRIAGNLVLTRLLAPEAFGAVGVITAVSYFLVMLTDLGFNGFVIRHRDGDKPHFLNVVWTVRLARNAILCILMFVFAGPLAAAFGKGELKDAIAICSLIILIDGLRSMSFVLAERQRRVAYMSAIDLAAFVIQTATAILAASMLGTYWAIVISMFAGAIANLVFSYALFAHSGQRPAFDRRILRDLWDFAKFVMPSSAITLVISQADRVVVGRRLDLSEFGLYMIGVNLAGAARGLINSWAVRIIYPQFAELGRTAPETAAESYYPNRRKLALPLAAPLGAMAGGGELLARILFPPEYLGAGVYISLLALGPLLAFVTLPAEMAMVALGRTRGTLEANIVRLAWVALAAPLGLSQAGLLGLVAAFALMDLPVALFWFWRFRQAKMLKLGEETLLLALALAGAGAGYGANLAVNHGIASGVLPAF